MTSLIRDLEMLTKWLSDFGLKVIESKMELSLFHCHDHTQITINMGELAILSEPCMNVIGVIFNSIHQCADYVLLVVKIK
jgi:hypothetical protein